MAEKIKSVFIIILALGLLTAGVSFATNGFSKAPELPKFLKNNEGSKVASSTVSYINKELLPSGTKASLEEVTTEHDLYKIKMTIKGKEQTSYVTKDGKVLFPQKITMVTTSSTSSKATSNDQTQNSQKEIPKEEKPKMELFIMSFCPYGNKAEQTMEPVYKLLGDKVDWNIHYIVSEQNGKLSSLHGQAELDQNARELCVLKNQGTKKWFEFANYVNENCGSEGKCWQKAAKDNNLDPEKITSCKDESGNEMQKEEAQISQEKGASGSPTLLINGVESEAVYKYGNPNAYKEAICSGFENPPAECKEELEAAENSQSNGGSC